MSTLEERYAAVLEDVAAAARDSGRVPAAITTIVVTKFHPAALVRQLAALGAHDLGENRHQEAAAKAADTADLGLTWHFIGQLQSNKAASVVEYASVIHSLDRSGLVEALEKTAAPVEVFIQLNLTEDPERGGIQGAELLRLAERVLAAPQLKLRGLMAVAPLGEPARPAFARVRAASERLRSLAPAATDLSMGMSGDYRDAILEGATHLRIGTAITGNRPPQG